ncbi:MAG: cytochrome c maturation protein CcmE [Acidobacteria bacterium]|nr:cytochrome c maturation protein CcmE [Acidobacteriota bacterium]
MSHKAVKIGLTSVVLALAFGGLLYSTLGESAQYYKHVEEVTSQPDAWYGKPLQIHGFARDIRRKRDSLDYSFEMHSKGQVVRATYTGIVPDTFKNESEVVLSGTLTADGFHATGMTAKCPSKYEPQAVGAAGTSGTAGAPGTPSY